MRKKEKSEKLLRDVAEERGYVAPNIWFLLSVNTMSANAHLAALFGASFLSEFAKKLGSGAETKKSFLAAHSFPTE